MKPRKNDSESGFTLIEVIITLVVVAIVAAMMTAYFGTGITQSSIPIFRLSAAGKINRIMEKITAEYDQIPRWSPAKSYRDTATPPASIVIPTPASYQDPRYQYKCKVAGTSAAMPPTGPGEPGWPIPGTTVAGGHVCSAPPDTLCTVPDGTVTWQLDAAAPTLMVLQTQIGVEVSGGQDYTQTFGDPSIPSNTISYRVIQNRFIKFVSNTESPVIPSDPKDYLKVTIGLPMAEANRTDETLTTLFVRR
jgi:prepilin-type N-terminal cleavage/methylation domain-containing protein